MAGVTTCTTNSFKQQLLMGGHCFQAPLSQTGNNFTSNNLINALTSTANLVVGMAVTAAAQIPTNTYIAYIINSTALVISNNATTAAQQSITFTGDQFNIGLIRFTGLAGTYDRTTSNYANVTTNSDECGASGTYATGGFALTNINPSVPDSNTAIATFSANPSWTSATINAEAAFIYNKGIGATLLPRFGTVGNNMVSLHDFGGAQQVTSGTFTLTLPTANGTAALLRIS